MPKYDEIKRTVTGLSILHAYDTLYDLGIQLTGKARPYRITVAGTASNDAVSTNYLKLALCDTAGNHEKELDDLLVAQGADVNGNWRYGSTAFTLDKSEATAKAWADLTNCSLAIKKKYSYATFLEPGTVFTIYTVIDEYNITIVGSTGGTLTADRSAADKGTVVNLTVTPDTGWELASITTSPSDLTVAGNKFIMPEADVTLTPVWRKINYNIDAAPNLTGAGTITAPETATYGEEIQATQVTATGYTFVRWELDDSEIADGAWTMPAANVKLRAIYSRNSYAITKVVEPAGAGSITAPASGGYQDKITVSQTPSTGYTFVGWQVSTGQTVTDNQFDMPGEAVTLKAIYQKNVYRITAEVSPAGAGVITVAGAATYGDEVTISQTPAEGYYFDPTAEQASIFAAGKFAMPNGDFTITAHYLHRSSVNLVTNQIYVQNPGGAATPRLGLNIECEDAAYRHKVTVNFGSNMTETYWIENASIKALKEAYYIAPASWAYQFTSGTRIDGGTLTLETYRGNVKIGEQTVTGLACILPDGYKPSIGSVTISELWQVDGTTFANVGAGYVQGHCGVKVTAGSLSMISTNEPGTLEVWLDGYGRTPDYYKKTQNVTGNTTAVFDSGLLINSRENTIHVRLTDCRGMYAEETRTIQVAAYIPPTITTFDCWRVDSTGTPDGLGEAAQYAFDYDYTRIGSNAVTTELKAAGATETNGPKNGWLLNADHKFFNKLTAYEIELTVRDAYESTTLMIRLGSGKYMMHFSQDGRSMAFGHAVEKTASNGYDGTYEIDGDMDIWYGNQRLRDYILDVVNGNA